MTVKIKSQKDYLVTEVTLEAPCNLNEIEALMRASHGTGKITAMYSGGGVVGVSVEQKARIPESVAQKVRDLVGIENQELNNGYHRR